MADEWQEYRTQWDLLCRELVGKKQMEQFSYRQQICNDCHTPSNATHIGQSHVRIRWCYTLRCCPPHRAHLIEFESESSISKSFGERGYNSSVEGGVDNVVEESNWQFADAPKGKCFKIACMYDIRESIFQFASKTIPIPRTRIPII